MINCFAYRERVNDDGSTSADCRCFEMMLCKYKECSMKKTAEQYAYDVASAKIRNRKLGVKRPGYGRG